MRAVTNAKVQDARELHANQTRSTGFIVATDQLYKFLADGKSLTVHEVGLLAAVCTNCSLKEAETKRQFALLGLWVIGSSLKWR